jgi:hypothetical protein
MTEIVLRAQEMVDMGPNETGDGMQALKLSFTEELSIFCSPCKGQAPLLQTAKMGSESRGARTHALPNGDVAHGAAGLASAGSADSAGAAAGRAAQEPLKGVLNKQCRLRGLQSLQALDHHAGVSPSAPP